MRGLNASGFALQWNIGLRVLDCLPLRQYLPNCTCPTVKDPAPSIRGGSGGWVVVSPPLFGGPPNFIKREKTLPACPWICCVLVLNSYLEQPPPLPPFRNPVSAPEHSTGTLDIVAFLDILPAHLSRCLSDFTCPTSSFTCPGRGQCLMLSFGRSK